MFNYAKVIAEPLCERIYQHVYELADSEGVSIEHVNKPHFRKEDLIAKVVAQRGKHHGLAQEIGFRLSTHIEGTCIKDSIGSASVKIYDGFKFD